MKRKIKITENQLALIVESETVQNKMVETIIGYLNNYYEPIVGVFAGEQEYTTGGLIHNNIDGTTLSPKALKDHLKYKFGNLSDEFMEQVISDWFNGKVDNNNNLLSKPVSM